MSRILTCEILNIYFLGNRDFVDEYCIWVTYLTQEEVSAEYFYSIYEIRESFGQKRPSNIKSKKSNMFAVVVSAYICACFGIITCREGFSFLLKTFN